jgi:hypothetical protein
MHVYKFKVNLEDQDNFYREIEILANQTFEDLHKVIIECGDFEGHELASFYLCDSVWKKMQEITLFDMNIDDEDDKEQIEMKNPLLTMDKAKFKNVINDPHQKIIYIYDYLEMWTFLLELYKISEADEKIIYPRIAKSSGKIIKKLKEIPVDAGFDDEEMGKEFEDALSSEDKDFLAEDSAFTGEEYFDEKF